MYSINPTQAHLRTAEQLGERPGISFELVQVVLHVEQPRRVRVGFCGEHQEAPVPRQQRYEKPQESLPGKPRRNYAETRIDGVKGEGDRWGGYELDLFMTTARRQRHGNKNKNKVSLLKTKQKIHGNPNRGREGRGGRVSVRFVSILTIVPTITPRKKLQNAYLKTP